MAYDEAIAGRVRAALSRRADVVEKRMFGGLAFMIAGHMAVGVQNDELMVRVGPDAYAKALARPHARPMDFTGRPLKGFVYVASEGFRTAGDMRQWVEMAASFAAAQPPRARAGRSGPKPSRDARRRPAAPSKPRPPGASRLRRPRGS